jgi:hypothetical protein
MTVCPGEGDLVAVEIEGLAFDGESVAVIVSSPGPKWAPGSSRPVASRAGAEGGVEVEDGPDLQRGRRS